MHCTLRLILAIPLLGLPAASGAVQAEREPLDLAAKRAQAEAQAADAAAAKLQKAANAAKDEAARLRARQAAAVQAISAAEARISEADANARIVAAQLRDRRARLAKEQAPAGSLLAGLALMSERPPLLSILDQGSTQEFVRVRLLLDSALPAIRKRTAALRAELEQGRALQQQADTARRNLVASRDALAERKQEFAALEAEAVQLAEKRGGEALGIGDVALARGEEAERLTSEAQRSREAQAIATELMRMPPAPALPGNRERPKSPAPFPYVLPANAAVVEGLGAVASNGVRSRGLTLATPRGMPVVVPASGTIRFAGPFRSYDSVVIIDHGGGWMSLLLEVFTQKRTGERVAVGEPLGRALGRISVELSRNGQHLSPAIIAGSSVPLSKERGRG